MRKLSILLFSFFLSNLFYNAVCAQDGGIGDKYGKIKLLSAKVDSNNTVLVVRVDAPYKDSVEAILTHSIGWVVEKRKVVLTTGPNNFNFNMAQLAAGTYRLMLRRYEGNWSVSQTIKKD
jgi:hypothetical protein